MVRILEEGARLVELSASIPEGAEEYEAIWHTNGFTLDPAKTYRITVLVGGVVLGFADVDVVATGRQLKNVNTGEYIPLLDGSTLPIHFRIELGAAAAIRDLGTLGGAFSSASDINNSGQVVGGSETSAGEFHAFLWDAATGMADLGTLGGTTSGAYGINDAGQVVGYSAIASGETHAFLWDAATGMTDLGTLGGPSSEARGINNAGQVVGGSVTTAGEFHAFLWDPVTGMTDLGASFGTAYSDAYGINDAGQVAGTTWGVHAYRWDPATGLLDLGTFSGGASVARGINKAGQVVGISNTASQEDHSFRWDEATGLTDLGSLGCCSTHAFGINDAGQVVGYSHLGGTRHAFLWDEATGMTDLGTLEAGNTSVATGLNGPGRGTGAGEFVSFVTFHGDPHKWEAPALTTVASLNSDARGMNDVGQVVGFSGLGSGETHATLWTIEK